MLAPRFLPSLFCQRWTLPHPERFSWISKCVKQFRLTLFVSRCWIVSVTIYKQESDESLWWCLMWSFRATLLSAKVSSETIWGKSLRKHEIYSAKRTRAFPAKTWKKIRLERQAKKIKILRRELWGIQNLLRFIRELVVWVFERVALKFESGRSNNIFRYFTWLDFVQSEARHLWWINFKVNVGGWFVLGDFQFGKLWIIDWKRLESLKKVFMIKAW